jgi:AraC-like DNA-binding protein/ligand-binding sensor protein
MSKTNIIQRRELKPLWSKATKMAQYYEKAGNCVTSVMGADFVFIEHSKHPKNMLFCSFCKRFHHDSKKMPANEYPCSNMHFDAVKEASRLGGSHVYTCPNGLFFWTSPFFSRGRFAGALIAGGALAIKRKQALKNFFNFYKGKISLAEIDKNLEGFPEKSQEDMKALSGMLRLCAENISCSGARYHDLTEYEHGHCCTDQQPYLNEKERLLIACLRRGDSTEAQGIARDILADFSNLADGDFEYFKMKAIELVVLISRTGTNSENETELVEANSRNIKLIEDSNTAGELADNVCLILERMAGKIFSFQGIRHASALRKAERFIWENYTRKISLKEIADASGLSAPYFSTVFKNEMGENLSNYLNRLRVEKALVMLSETDSPINGISAACGFEDQSWFSKVFKSYTGISPYEYRKNG